MINDQRLSGIIGNIEDKVTKLIGEGDPSGIIKCLICIFCKTYGGSDRICRKEIL